MASSNTGQRMIENRRKADNAYREMDAAIHTDRKVHLMAKFEINSQARIETRTKQNMFEEKKKSYDENLAIRRKKLAALYNEEMEGWQYEVLGKVETQEDRKSRIMQKAYALRDAREKDRQEFVKQRLDDQWRDSCDDARTLDSKAMTLFMNQERIRQIQEKIQRKQQLSSQEGSFLEEWNRQLEALAKKDSDKEEYRRRVDKETADGLRQQMNNNEKMKEQYYRNLRREEEEELARLRKEIEADESLQYRKQEEAHARGRDVMKFNLEEKKIRESESHIGREHDAILLEYALRKERDAIAAEEWKKNADRQAALQYRKYLEEQMIKEAEDTAFVDEIRKREEEKVWKARDEALQAREDARNNLMRMVDEGRQEQIKYKHEILKREKQDDSKFVKKFMDDATDAVRVEQEVQDRRRQINMDNNVELTKQIELKRYKEELVKQEEYLADKQMQYRERQHQQRLAQQAGSVRLNYQLHKNQWYT